MKKKPHKLKLTLQNIAKQPQTPTKQQFSQWVQAAALIKNFETLEITIRLVSPQESAALNEQYRHKTGPTNVLSFTYPTIGVEASLLGDLVICADLVKAEAQAAHKPMLSHWAHLTVHGILHLQGYDHIEPNDAEEMEQLEIRILQALGFSNPYR